MGKFCLKLIGRAPFIEKCTVTLLHFRTLVHMVRCLFIFSLLLTNGIVSPGQPTYAEAFPGITFTAPVELLSPPDQSKYLFVVQQNGIVKILPNKKNLSPAEVKDFLNISTKLVTGGERGLLGMAFHPDFATNGYFYVCYTRPSPLTSVISRFSVHNDHAFEADPDSELILLTQSQPYDNHNGGKLAFGTDGYLYISIGDGGSGGDPQNNAQNLTNLLGKILRIDVDVPDGDIPYSIPADNPFKGNTQEYREEIFAYGLRNVWKFSVDHETGTIWGADVGQGAREEINLVESGKNFGWRLMEGTLCYNPSTNCNPGNLVLPIFEYPHTDNNRSITGGYVYRGLQIPEWTGQYIYGDYISGRIWKLSYANDEASNAFLLTSGGLISSFGEDHNKELYVLHYSGGSSGKIYRFFPSAPQAPAGLVVQYADNDNRLSWIDESDNELGFIIERALLPGNDFEIIDTVMYNTISFSDNISNADDYTYRIRSYNDGGESDYIYAEEVVVGFQNPQKEPIAIYPNPASGKVRIEFPTSRSEMTQIRIMDAVTKTVRSTILANRDVSVNVDHLLPGFYVIEITNRFGTTTRKLIIR